VKVKAEVIKTVDINLRKKCVEIRTSRRELTLPFARLRVIPTKDDPVREIYVDDDLGRRGITYSLVSGREDSIHLDAFLDYNRDPDFLRAVFLRQITMDARKLFDSSGLSKHEVARRLETSPSQLYRLLDPTNKKKSADEMIRLMSVLGWKIEWRLVRDVA
jgi:hypothetical protein